MPLSALKPLERTLKPPAKPRKRAKFPRGPAQYRAIKSKPKRENIFWPPPPDFRTSRTSNTEWMPYVCFSLIFKKPTYTEIVGAPYLGGEPFWSYQKFVDGGRTRATSADFVIWPSSKYGKGLIFRIQTERIHNYTTAFQQQFDRNQRFRLQTRSFRVVDLYDADWLWDKSGRACMYFIRQGLAGIERSSLPTSHGHLRRGETAR